MSIALWLSLDFKKLINYKLFLTNTHEKNIKLVVVVKHNFNCNVI